MFILEHIKAYAKTDRIALVNREQSLRYARSEAFAAWLLERFGADRTPVIIYGHKETDFLPCIYGTLKSGRAYVPVGLSVPPDRVAEIVADIAPKVIADFSGTLPASGAGILNGDDLKQIMGSPTKTEISKDKWVSGNDPALPRYGILRVRKCHIGADGLTPFKRSIAIKKMAAKNLPDYMIPRKIIVVDAFPLNTNGKVDKKALEASLQGETE